MGLRIENKNKVTKITFEFKAGWWKRSFLTWLLITSLLGLIFGLIGCSGDIIQENWEWTRGFWGGFGYGALVVQGFTVIGAFVFWLVRVLGMIWGDETW